MGIFIFGFHLELSGICLLGNIHLVDNTPSVLGSVGGGVSDTCSRCRDPWPFDPLPLDPSQSSTFFERRYFFPLPVQASWGVLPREGHSCGVWVLWWRPGDDHPERVQPTSLQPSRHKGTFLWPSAGPVRFNKQLGFLQMTPLGFSDGRAELMIFFVFFKKESKCHEHNHVFFKKKMPYKTIFFENELLLGTHRRFTTQDTRTPKTPETFFPQKCQKSVQLHTKNWNFLKNDT